MTTMRVEIELTHGDLELQAKLEVARDAPVALVGPNGAGKTTLLRAILGVVAPRRGRITVGDHTLFDSSTNTDLPTERRRLGYVPQDYGLFPHLDVLQNVRFGLDSRRTQWSDERREACAHTLLEQFELVGLAERRPGHLSGGERQRVALARALASEPDVLLLDEPLAALDVTARRRVRDSLAEHLGALNLPTLLVTHDPADVERLAERIVVLEDGRTTATPRQDPSGFAEAFFAEC